jgi:hypothetical protein
MTLERALEYIEEDDLVEVTPTAIRLRKRFLKESDRRRVKTGAEKFGVLCVRKPSLSDYCSDTPPSERLIHSTGRKPQKLPVVRIEDRQWRNL